MGPVLWVCDEEREACLGKCQRGALHTAEAWPAALCLGGGGLLWLVPHRSAAQALPSSDTPARSPCGQGKQEAVAWG